MYNTNIYVYNTIQYNNNFRIVMGIPVIGIPVIGIPVVGIPVVGIPIYR